MNKVASHDELKRMHQTYCDLCPSHAIPWDSGRMYAWEMFSLHFTHDDLVLLIKYIQRKERLHQPSRSLMFRSLISGPGSIHYAQEDLQQAKCEGRIVRHVKDKASVLRATGRVPEPEHGEAKTVGHVLHDPEPAPAKAPVDAVKASEALAKFKEWRQANDL